MQRVATYISLLLIGAVCIATLVLIFFWSTKPVESLLLKVNLYPRKEAVTELYLENTRTFLETVPRPLASGSMLSFSFVIHNTEGVTVPYSYSVYILDAQKRKTILESKSVTLADGKLVSIPISHIFSAPVPTAPAVVYIDLVGRKESLHFALPQK